ncbi:MAG: nucleotide exchange factor GrpE [Oscillospiraceae bacterium]
MSDNKIIEPELESMTQSAQEEPTKEPEQNDSKANKKADKKADKKEAAQPTELETLQSDYATLNDKYLRLAAEYDNFRRRTARERESIYPDAMAAAVGEFLAVADNFERALAAPCTDAEYKKGTEMTYKSLTEAFDKLGVQAFGKVGDPFDPSQHNAVMHIEDEAVKEATVVETFQKGYRLGERVLRCAMVKVAN